MSFTPIRQVPTRLNRSQLFVLSTDTTAIQAAARSEADVIFFELEDAVAPERKAQARSNVLEALNDLDWEQKTVSMRINGLDTPHMYRDLVDILEGPSERLDLVLVPKAGTACDIYAVDMLVTQIEQATDRKKRLGLEVMIETAQGMTNIEEIARGSPRLEALHFGENDYATSMGIDMRGFAAPHPEYSMLTDGNEAGERERHWGDMWHYALSRVVATARANGLRPVDVGFIDPNDPDGFFAAARRAAVLGFEGKWAADEEAIKLANAAFTPSKDKIERARRILTVVAENPDQGVFEVDGKRILMPQVRDAEILSEKAQRMGL
jgi:malyl-CoA/(S)-citramalyl-CoA lyase